MSATYDRRVRILPLLVAATLGAAPVTMSALADGPPDGALAAAAPAATETSAATPDASLSAWPGGELPPNVTASEVVLFLSRLGLDPASVAAAGLDAPAAAGLVSSAAESLSEVEAALVQADEGVLATRATAEALRAKLVAGTATQEEKATWPAVRQAADAAVDARSALHDQLFAVVVASLSDSAKSAAANIRSSAATWSDVAPPYRVVVRDEAAMLALRDALDAERIALKREREVPEAVAALLAQARAEPAVATALASTAANAQVIAQTWAAEAAAPPVPNAP